MDPARFIPIAERLSASIGATWATTMLEISHHMLPTWEISVAMLLFTASVHTLTGRGSVEPPDIVKTIRRLLLTVFAQHLFSFTPTETSSIVGCVQSVSYASIVLMVLDGTKSIFSDESSIFMTSSKFMFARVLQGSFEILRGGEVFTPVIFLVLAYVTTRTFFKNCVITDGLCMMVFDEMGLLTLTDKWSFQTQLLISIVISRHYKVSDPLLQELQQYSRWQVAAAFLTLLSPMSFVSSYTLLILVIMGTSYTNSQPAIITIHDISILTLFNISLQKVTHTVMHMVPGNTLVAFCFSVAFFSIVKNLTTRKK